MEQKIISDFINGFNELKNKINRGELPEKALFDIEKTFYQQTGGKLSHYNSPLAVGVAVVKVKREGKLGLLGFKRGIPPFVGGVAFPGGFVNQNEGSKEASIRELSEETNLILQDETMWQHIGEKKTPANQLLIFYKYNDVLNWEDVEKAYDSLADKSESQGLVFLDENTEMCFSLHSEIRDEVFASEIQKKPKP